MKLIKEFFFAAPGAMIVLPILIAVDIWGAIK